MGSVGTRGISVSIFSSYRHYRAVFDREVESLNKFIGSSGEQRARR